MVLKLFSSLWLKCLVVVFTAVYLESADKIKSLFRFHFFDFFFPRGKFKNANNHFCAVSLPGSV